MSNFVFFSGFCLAKEQELLCEYIPSSGVVGFSKGCIDALEYVVKHEHETHVTLISPSIYSDATEGFKNAQLAAFMRDKTVYAQTLLRRAGLTRDEIERYCVVGSVEELRRLLFFDWYAIVQKIMHRGINLDIIVGDADKIVSHTACEHLFSRIGTLYIYKQKNHIIR